MDGMRDQTLERRFVGCAMVDPAILDRCSVGCEHLTGLDERRVLECLFSLRDQGQSVSGEALAIELRRRGYEYLATSDPFAWAASVSIVSCSAPFSGTRDLPFNRYCSVSL